MKQVYTKSEARKIAKAARNTLTMEEVFEHSIHIFDSLITMREYRDCNTVLAYADCNQEVATSCFIDKCLEDGKDVAMPRVESAGIMEFYFIHARTELVSGKFGILEPMGGQKYLPDKNSSAIMIMPGVAFDVACHRAGYGGGYYDRYLMRCPEIITIAVCHEIQLLNEIITEEHDICPDILITENRTLYKNPCI